MSDSTLTLTQAYFMANGLEAGNASPDTECSRCTELCIGSKDIVKLVLNSHSNFHRACILPWLMVSHTEECTCTDDRNVLSRTNLAVDIPVPEVNAHDRFADALHRHIEIERDQNPIIGTGSIIAK